MYTKSVNAWSTFVDLTQETYPSLHYTVPLVWPGNYLTDILIVLPFT